MSALYTNIFEGLPRGQAPFCLISYYVVNPLTSIYSHLIVPQETPNPLLVVYVLCFCFGVTTAKRYMYLRHPKTFIAVFYS